MRDSNSRGVAPSTLAKCAPQRPWRAGIVREVRLSVPADRGGRTRTQASETIIETTSRPAAMKPGPWMSRRAGAWRPWGRARSIRSGLQPCRPGAWLPADHPGRPRPRQVMEHPPRQPRASAEPGTVWCGGRRVAHDAASIQPGPAIARLSHRGHGTTATTGSKPALKGGRIPALYLLRPGRADADADNWSRPVVCPAGTKASGLARAVVVDRIVQVQTGREGSWLR